jgi:hypothetical protein
MLTLQAVLITAVYFAAQSQTPGVLAGCLTDPTGQALPGVTIIATGNGLRRTTEANANGCYELKAVAPASYRVTAKLLGFDNVTRDGVLVAAGSVTRLNLTTRTSGICECVLIAGTLAEHRRNAAAVLHVRLTGPALTQSAGSYRHTATVLTVLKRPTGGLRAAQITVVQNQESGSGEPYDVGQELVGFFDAAGRSDAFSIVNQNPGLYVGNDRPSMVFVVTDGRIQGAPSAFAGFIGMPISDFLRALGG